VYDALSVVHDFEFICLHVLDLCRVAIATAKLVHFLFLGLEFIDQLRHSLRVAIPFHTAWLVMYDSMAVEGLPLV
jgi:hypothetical protein